MQPSYREIGDNSAKYCADCAIE
jgi:hypothetical protein